MIGLQFKIQDDQQTLRKLDSIQQRFPGALRQGVHRQALRLQAVIKTGIRSGAPGGVPLAPNAPLTIRLKRSSKPLINHGDLVRSVGTNELPGADAAYFVGVNRAARDPNGVTPMATIAEWMEEGTRPHVIPITPGVRAFFRAKLGIHLSARQQYLMHPGTVPRPFMRPSIAFWQQDVERLLQEHLVKTLGPAVAL